MGGATYSTKLNPPSEQTPLVWPWVLTSAESGVDFRRWAGIVTPAGPFSGGGFGRALFLVFVPPPRGQRRVPRR